MPSVQCPSCKKQLSVPAERLGTEGKCPGCGTKVSIPATVPTSAGPSQIASRQAGRQAAATVPKFNETALAAAAQRLANYTRLAAYGVAATVVIMLTAAGYFLFTPLGHSFIVMGGFAASIVFGLSLFAAYWCTRHRVYNDALVAERRRWLEYCEELRNPNSAKEADRRSLGYLISVVGVLIAGFRSFRFGSHGRDPSGEGILYGIIAVFVISLVGLAIWSVYKIDWKSTGGMRTLLFAHAGLSLTGLLVICLDPFDMNASATLAASSRSGATPPMRAIPTALDILDLLVVSYCLAPKNEAAVVHEIKVHGRDKVAFVEIKEPFEQSNLLDKMHRMYGFCSSQLSSDGRATEVIFAPIDELEYLVKQMDGFEVLEVDQLRRRIKVRAPTQEISDGNGSKK